MVSAWSWQVFDRAWWREPPGDRPERAPRRDASSNCLNVWFWRLLLCGPNGPRRRGQRAKTMPGPTARKRHARQRMRTEAGAPRQGASAATGMPFTHQLTTFSTDNTQMAHLYRMSCLGLVYLSCHFYSCTTSQRQLPAPPFLGPVACLLGCWVWFLLAQLFCLAGLILLKIPKTPLSVSDARA